MATLFVNGDPDGADVTGGSGISRRLGLEASPAYRTSPTGQKQMAVATDTVAAAWASKAQALAQWTAAHMVNRADQWAQYLPLHERSYSRIVRTAPPKQMRGRVFLTTEILARHYVGADVGDLVGLHAKGLDNSARWITIDLGDRDPSAPATPAANLKAALAWYDTLREQGFHPILEDSSSHGDYHLWVIFGDKVDAGTAWMFARTLVNNYADLLLPAVPKIYPRRAPVDGTTLKDWVRLPGRHHSQDHWSKFWDGARWLEGAEAVDALLATRIAPGHFAARSASRPAPLQPSPPAERHLSLEDQVAEVYQLPPESASAEPPAVDAQVAVPEPSAVAGPEPASQPSSDEPDIDTVVQAWPDLPLVVKECIMAMVRSAQNRR